VPDIASAYQSRMKTADLSSGEEVAIFEKLMADVSAAGVDFSNDFTTVELHLSEPTLDDTMPDNERITWALQEALGVEHVEIPFDCMLYLAKRLREDNFHVFASGLRKGNTFVLMDVTSTEQPMCAVAIDIGTTTVSAVLMDLKTGKL